MCAYNIQNIFSIACRDRCMSKLRTLIPLPTSTKGPCVTAAVLVPLCRVNGEPSLLYTLRNSNMGTNVGQITFPGGRMEKDETAVQTALRETKEAIGLAPDKINIWGQGPAIPSRDTNFMITPVIGAIHELKQTDLNVNANEVAEAFTVPLTILCDPKNQYYTQFGNGYILPVFIAEDYKIWGISAYITHAFLSCALSKEAYQNEWLRKKIDLKSSH